MKKFLSMVFALSLLSYINLSATYAEESPKPIDVDEEVYTQLLKSKWELDENSDGIITEEELEQATQLTIDLDGINDISWLSRMKTCEYLSIENGTLTDFSVLKDMPSLRDLSMFKVPLTDISFMKDLNLEYCWFSGMDYITPEQRIEVLKFANIELWEGELGLIDYHPRGFVDYQFTIDDSNVASFLNGSGSTENSNENIYGLSAGKTGFTVSLNGNDYFRGEITVKKTPDAFDPALHNSKTNQFEAGRSYYYNKKPDGNSGIITLVNGTLYSVSGGEVKAVESDVQDYESIYRRSYSKSYNYADMVLKTDGTLLVNGESLTDVKFKAMSEGYLLGENGNIYCMVPSGDDFSISVVVSDTNGWVEGCNPLFVTKDNHLKYYSVKLVDDGKISVFIGNTYIGEPISACKTGSNCYVVDKSHTLFELGFSDSFSKKKIADNVLSVNTLYSGEGVEYTKTDGSSIILNKTSIYGRSSSTNYLGIDCGVFYIPEYQNRGIEENDAVFDYTINRNRTLTLFFLGNHCGLTNVYGEIGETYDVEQDHGYVYFLRTDGSIWKYNLDDQQWQEAVAGTATITDTKIVKGDINSDGKLNVSDAVLFQKWLNKAPDVYFDNWKIADLFEDEKLDFYDMVIMRRELISQMSSEN